MKLVANTLLLSMSLALAGCGPGDSAKTSAAPAAKVDAKVEEKPHAPDSHGMPGMSELFKGDAKKDEKK